MYFHIFNFSYFWINFIPKLFNFILFDSVFIPQKLQFHTPWGWFHTRNKFIHSEQPFSHLFSKNSYLGQIVCTFIYNWKVCEGMKIHENTRKGMKMLFGAWKITIVWKRNFRVWNRNLRYETKIQGVKKEPKVWKNSDKGWNAFWGYEIGFSLMKIGFSYRYEVWKPNST